MVTKTQTFSPIACECVFEEIYELDKPEEKKLFFVTKVCSRHEYLVKNQPKLSQSKLDQERNNVMSTVEGLLDNNKIKNLGQWDDNDGNKQAREAIKELKKSAQLEKHALKLEAQEDFKRQKISQNLDNFKEDKMNYFLVGVHSPYAFNAQVVYDTVLQESKANEQ